MYFKNATKIYSKMRGCETLTNIKKFVIGDKDEFIE